MGYTHYWKQNQPLPEEAQTRWSVAIADCHKVIRTAKEEAYYIQDRSDETGLCFNGMNEEGHEDFLAPILIRDIDLSFCKTERKPYDREITACLCVLAETGLIAVTSDGSRKDWAPGAEFASRILGRDIPIPPRIRD